MKKHFLSGCLALLLMTVTSLASAANFGSFTAMNAKGGLSTQKVFSSKALNLVYIWTSSTEGSQEETAALQAMQSKYGPYEFQVVSIVADAFNAKGAPRAEAVTRAKAIINANKLTYTTLFASSNMLQTNLANVGAVPTSFFVDRAGNIISEPILGSHTQLEWDNIIYQHYE